MRRTRWSGLGLAGVLSIACAACQPAQAPAPAATDTTAVSHAVDYGRVAGPVEGTRLTEAYARLVARDAFFWSWPMVNIYNRRLMFAQVPEPGLSDGVIPVAPLNRLAMLHDYVDPSERQVACPNQDVVYGAGVIALDQGPVVVQVPDFGKRFWVYQVVDLRTDSFADLGAMYGTAPGFYLLVGPNWNGDTPRGITRIFRSKTNTGFLVPRVFQDDTPEDKQAVQAVLAGIDIYPLADFDGKMKSHDWHRLKTFPGPPAGSGETKWVRPDRIFDQLPAVLADAPPLPGERGRYEQVLAVIAAASQDPAIRRAMVDEATKAEAELVDPLLEFRTFGLPLPHHWTTVSNGAAFGTDYFTRTAVARSNILVNRQNETKYFYQDLDDAGVRLNGANRYTVTYSPLPPVRGFWSLTVYDRFHFFAPNDIQRYSIGTKNKDLRTNSDGSLTIYVQSTPPADPTQRANWLPSPSGQDFSLVQRAYWPQAAILDGSWTPPAVVKVK